MPREIYVSTDVETDGPIPGPNSMLSLGSAAWLLENGDKRLVSTFSANLQTLPGAVGAPDTMAWWSSQPEAWAVCRAQAEDPVTVMRRYSDWLGQLEGTPVFVAWPLGFDFTFVYWYLVRFTGSSPFRHHGIDIRSCAMAMLGKGYKECGKDSLPRRWFDESPHTHVALDDAIEQGALFCNMIIEARARIVMDRRDMVSVERVAPQGNLLLRIVSYGDMPGVSIVNAIGDIDEVNADFFIQQLLDLHGIAERSIVLELGGVRDMEPGVAQRFDNALKKTSLFRGRLIIVDPSPRVYETMRIVGISQFVSIAGSVREALDCFGYARGDGTDAFFPKIFNCPICRQRLLIKRPKRIRCKQCKTILVVDETGQVLLG